MRVVLAKCDEVTAAPAPSLGRVLDLAAPIQASGRTGTGALRLHQARLAMSGSIDPLTVLLR